MPNSLLFMDREPTTRACTRRRGSSARVAEWTPSAVFHAAIPVAPKRAGNDGESRRRNAFGEFGLAE